MSGTETATKVKTGLRSMTGYAVVRVEEEDYSLTASLHSVNHRYMDLRLHMPDLLLPLENKIRAILQNRKLRGHLNLKLVLDTRGASDVAVDEELAARYLETMLRLGSRFQIPSQPEMETILQMPGVILKKDLASSLLELTAEAEAKILAAVEDVVEKWDDVRAAEAALLVVDLQSRIAGIGAAAERMEQWQQEVLELAQKRLVDKLQALAGSVGIDPDRLAQEAAILAERTDVTEEITRLKAHVKQFSGLLAGGADAGKKLDFLLQEMNRENNTLLSKMTGLGECSLAMTEAGLDSKAEIEKLREQIQNLQ